MHTPSSRTPSSRTPSPHTPPSSISPPGRVKAPYGLAFPVHELVFIRAWSEKRGLSLRILLDQVLDAAEFEEMLLIRGHIPSHRALTLWRIDGGVVAQAEGGQPRVFGGVHAALSHAGGMFALKPARVPSAWRRLLGLGPR
jgi:hypothetical protein